MKSPGYLLVHSLPDKGLGVRAARKTDGIAEATEIIERYCADIGSWDGATQTDVLPIWDQTLTTMAAQARAEAFRVLAGQALADWHDWPEAFAEVTSTEKLRMK